MNQEITTEFDQEQGIEIERDEDGIIVREIKLDNALIKEN